MGEREQQIRETTQIYKDFPKKGVDFLDIFPIIAKPSVMKLVIDIFTEQLEKVDYNKIFMLESRGFLFAVPLSQRVGVPVYPIRKKGKLPGECVEKDYGLEYGKDVIEIQK